MEPTPVLVFEPGRHLPAGLMSWQRAIVLAMHSDEVRKAAARGEIIRRLDEDGKAMPFVEVLAWQGEDDEPVIVRSGGGVEHLVPAVVCLTRPTGRRKAHLRYSFDNVYSRDNGECQYCGVFVPRGKATREHVVPRAQGGATSWENVVVACDDCNARKADRTPAQAGMTIRRQPVAPAPFSVFPRGRRVVPKEWRRFLGGSIGAS